jgi:Protein of unknown function VcgC/VcgE (DUF2780)
MADIVDSLAQKLGIPPETAHKGVATLLNFLKTELGDQTFSKIESSVPGASGLADQAEPLPESGQGGLLGTITSLASKVLGGQSGGAAKLLEGLSALGLQPQQVEAFVAQALTFIKQHVPPDLLQKVMASLPALAALIPSETKSSSG